MAKVTLQRIDELQAVFRKLGWLPDGPVEGGGRLIDAFTQLLREMTVPEQDMLLALLPDFLRCEFPDYERLLRQAILGINLKAYAGKRSTYLVPATDLRRLDRGLAKSGSILPYILGYEVLPKLGQPLPGAVSLASIKALSDFVDRENALVVFLDDFIGTGKSVIDALGDYECHYRAAGDFVLVVALVCQKSGYQSIQALGYPVHSAFVRERGVTDCRRFPDPVSILSMMDTIGMRIGAKREHWHGYGASESLVKMIRSPNSTFPLFWHSGSGRKKPWPAPFPRYSE